MRELFGGYYPPTEAEYERLWTEGVIAVDTNVLLSLYRLPLAAREEFFGVLDALRDRLWIPHHVGVEFQRRRVGVILEARERADAVLKKAQEHLAATQGKVLELELDKSGLDIDPEKLLTDLKDASGRLIDAIKTMHDSLVDASSTDPIRDRIDELFAGRIGAAPVDQAALAELTKDADDRYTRAVPPGFRDVDKDNDRAGPTFLFNGVTYERRHGDLIIWRQLLTHAREVGASAVLFVTSDQKDDWWWIEHGRTLGPQPELVHEIGRDAGVTLFWMYSAKSFANFAGRYTSATVSEKSLVDIDTIASTNFTRLAGGQEASSAFLARRYGRPEMGSNRALSLEVEQIVFQWLLSQGFRVVEPESRFGFPDFTLEAAGDLPPHGVEVKFSSRPDQMFNPRLVDESMMRGYIEVEEGRLSDITLVFVIVQDREGERRFGPLEEDVERAVNRLESLIARLESRMSRRAINVLLGFVDGRDFIPIRGWGQPFAYGRR